MRKSHSKIVCIKLVHLPYNYNGVDRHVFSSGKTSGQHNLTS